MISRDELAIAEKERFEARIGPASEAFRASGGAKSSLWRVLFDDLPVPLQEPYGLRLVNRPISWLVPLYRQIIVPVRPTSRTGFVKLYGVPLPEFTSLVEQGRIVPILSKEHAVYPRHFDDLFFRVHVPEASRVRKFLYLERGEGPITKDVHAYCDGLLSSRLEFRRSIGREFGGDAKSRSVAVIRGHLSDLCAFGYDHLVAEILRCDDPEVVFEYAALATILLTDPFSRGLGGIANYELRKLAKFRGFDEPFFLGAAMYSLPNPLVLPIGKVVDLPRYWDSVDLIEEREESLALMTEIASHLTERDFEGASKRLELDRPLFEGVTEEAARRALAIRVRPSLDFGFSVLAPALLSSVAPEVSTGLLVLTAGAKQVAAQKWNQATERIAYLLSGAVESLLGTESIAVGATLRLD